MADRQDVVVYADGGDMTVARTIPAYVLGAFDVVLPDGREQEKGDDRIRNGYIYRPPEPATGSLDVGFIKADVKLDLGAKTSSLERVVDSAIRRTEGDVFFERDISSSGLGGFIPGRDFDLHDVIRVDVWGKLLPSPVTAVDFEGSVSHHLGTRVHVGGQMITDAEALQAKTDATLERLESERRQRLKELGAVGAKADRANENAKNAQGSADQAQETADDAIKKWREQKDALDKVQSAQIETNAKVNDAQQHAIEANSTALTLAPRFLHIDDGKPGFYGSSSGKLSTGAEFGSLEFRGTTFTKNSGAAFVSKAGWQGSILMICVATNGATDITATEITQAGQVHEMHAGGSFQAYRSATVVVLPVFSERKG